MPNPIPDDELRLIFTCCHPALPADARIALTLGEVGGLTTEEVARAYVRPPRGRRHGDERSRRLREFEAHRFLEQIGATHHDQSRLAADSTRAGVSALSSGGLPERY